MLFSEVDVEENSSGHKGPVLWGLALGLLSSIDRNDALGNFPVDLPLLLNLSHQVLKC